MATEDRTQLPRAAIRALWIGLTEIYGRHWTDTFGDSEGGAARAWSKGLAGLTIDQIAIGLQACVVSADPMPSTLPEFRARCLGIPSLPQVRHELRSPGLRSVFTHLVWELMDKAAYAAANSTTAERILREAYALAKTQRMGGTPLPLPQPAPLAITQRQETWRAPPPWKRAKIIARARAELEQ